MRICLIGHCSKSHDEGVRNIYYYLYKELKKHNKVLYVNIEYIIKSFIDIKKFDPQIIHLVVGPSTILDFFLSKFLSLCFTKSKIVMSAPQPSHLRFKRLIRLLKPDLLLIQSISSEKFFTELGCKTFFVSNGVDVKKFLPVDSREKLKLREKYGIGKEKFVVLHVGHIKKSRNISVLKEVQRDDNQVICVGSTLTIINQNIYNDLKSYGCFIWTDYFKEINEIYALSDCYVFPTIDKYNAIEIPLSVLEAMSCNLPVISTRFGGLNRLFPEGNGLYFIDEKTSLLELVMKVKVDKDSISVNTRNKVQPYSWERIVRKMENIYETLLC